MDLLRAASHRSIRHMLRNAMSSNVNMMIRGFATTAEKLESEQVVEKMNRSGDCVSDMSKAEELRRADRTRQVKRLSPNKTAYTYLIDSFCKQDRFDVASRVLNEMIVSGFPPSFVTLNDVLRGFLRLGDIRNAYEMRKEINQHPKFWMNDEGWTDYDGWFCEDCWMVEDTKSSLYEGLSDELTYTHLMNAYIDEGKLNNAAALHYEVKYYFEETFFHPLPHSVMYSVYINGLKNLLRFNYKKSLCMPILEYHSTLAEYYFSRKSLVDLVNSFCNRGLKNAYEPYEIQHERHNDGLVYNLYVIAHCKRHNIDEAYNMYQDMVHYGFPCHMFTVFALIKTLKREDMVNELLWVIQNVLRSCNLKGSEILKFLNEFNPKKPMMYVNEAFFNVLAEKAKGGLLLKCSYASPSA